MKAIRLFSMAALAIMMAACSNDLNEITEQPQQPQQAEGIPFKAILPAPGSDAATRTTYGTFGGASGLPVSWRAKDGTYDGDQIALLHNGVKDVATVTAVDASGNATIEAIITGSPADNDDVVLVYPAASVNSTGSGTGFTPDATYAARQLAQDGTLEYIANYLDGREGSGKLLVNSEGASLKSNVSMASKIAIWQFWLKDTQGNDLPATKVTMKLGNQAIAQASPGPGLGTNLYYMCLVPKSLQTLYAAAASASLPTPVFCIEATKGTDTYTYPVFTQMNLTVNTFYQTIEIRLGKLGDVMGSNGKFYRNGLSMPSGVTPIGVLAYIGDDDTTEPTYGCGHGLVLGLKNAASDVVWSTDNTLEFSGQEVTSTEGLKRTTNVSGYTTTLTLATKAGASFATKYPAAAAAKTYTGLTAPTGSMGWFLPSAQQWVKILESLGGLANGAPAFEGWFDNNHIGIDNIEAAMVLAGSGKYESMKSTPQWYWTSSEFSRYEAIRLSIDATDQGAVYGLFWLSYEKTLNTSSIGTGYVRPILAF